MPLSYNYNLQKSRVLQSENAKREVCVAEVSFTFPIAYSRAFIADTRKLIYDEPIKKTNKNKNETKEDKKKGLLQVIAGKRANQKVREAS